MAISRDQIERIVHAGVQAPSGDNTQPWRFVIAPNHLNLYNVPERDTSLYAWGQRSSLLAHGAAIENMHIAAAAEGITIDSAFSQAPHEAPNHVARIALTEAEQTPHPLADFIAHRATNRKPFSKQPLTDIQRAGITELVAQEPLLQLVEDAPARRIIAAAAAANEKVLFENKAMHQFLFDHILFRDSDQKIGFPLATFELPPPIRLAFRALRHWSIMSLFNRIRFADLIAKTNTGTYASGAALIAITMPDRSPHSYLTAGRTMQRAWLTATSLGLQVQPLTGVPFLMNQAANTRNLSTKHAHIVRDAYTAMEDALGNATHPIALFLRIGNGAPPSARTLRSKPLMT